MNTFQNRLILIAGVLLVGLIALTIFITTILNSNKQPSQQPTFVPTGTFESGGFRGGTSPTLTQQQLDKLINETKNVPILSADQSDRMVKAGDKLPFTSGDLDIAFSPTLDAFFVQKKTPQADAMLQKFLQDNNLQDVFQNFSGMFVFTTQPVDQAIQQAEQQLGQQRDQFQQQIQQELSQTPAPPQSQNNQPQNNPPQGTENTLQPLVDLMKSLVNLDLGPTLAPAPTEPPGGGGGNIPTAMLPYSSTPKPLYDIFVEAGTNVGAPPILLEAIMHNECPWIISFPSQKIINYSIPGKGILPGDPDTCFKNPSGCQGPMQFANGYPNGTCGRGCNYCTWRSNAHAVNTYGGYHYPPSVENIRDSVYGAALYMRNLANPANKFNWTKSEIFGALQHYSGGGCPPYCDRLWMYISGRH